MDGLIKYWQEKKRKEQSNMKKSRIKVFLSMLLVACMIFQLSPVIQMKASDSEDLMSGATLTSSSPAWEYTNLTHVVDGNHLWVDSAPGHMVQYDGEGGMAYYQADFTEAVSIGQVRLYMHYDAADRPGDIAVDVKLVSGVWVRVAEKHNINYSGIDAGGDLVVDWKNDNYALYLAMNFEAVECVAFRVSGNNARTGASNFRVKEIEAYSTYPSDQSVTGIVKDANDSYNIPYIFSNVNLMTGATLSSTTSVWWNSTPTLVDGEKIWDPNNYGEAVAYDGEGGVAYYQADFAEAVSLGQVRLYMYYAGSDGAAKDIAVDVKLSNGTWVRVAEKHNIIYKGTHEGGDLTLTYQGSSPAMYLAMNFETVDCVAFRVSAKNNRDGVGSFRLVEIEAYNTYPAGQSLTGTVKDTNDAYNIPRIYSDVNLMAYATLSSTTSVWWNSTPTLVDGDKIWDPNNYGEAVAYDGEEGMAYYQADFAEELPLGQVRLYMYYAGSDGSPKDIAIDVKLSDGTWVRVAEKHDITYSGTHEGGDLTLTYQGSSPAMYLAMNFDEIDCVGFRVSANKERNGVGSFRLVEIEAFSTYPSDQSVTGTERDKESKYNIPCITTSKVISYTAEEFAGFRDAEIKEYPTARGFVFAGWYADEACTEVLVADTIDSEAVAYAKFVDKNVLTVRAQITAKEASDTSSHMRFVTTVDSLDYAEIGFKVKIEGREEVTRSSKVVYDSLYALGSDNVVDTLKPESEFSTISKHFAVYSYRNIPQSHFGTTFTVTPYWITLDGTVVEGETAVKTVSMGL